MNIQKPNIVFIMADDMGYGDVGCYNPQSKIPTPHMDRLAGQGVRFVDAHSASAVCTPSRYAVLTGRYCWRTRLKRHVLFNYERPLIEPSRMTVASMLKGHGYRTACIGKWHLGLGWHAKAGHEFDFDRPLPWPGGSLPREEEEKIDFTRPIFGGPRELGFDTFFGTGSCSTCNPPYCFIENDRTVGVPDVYREAALPEERSGFMTADWDPAEADTTFTARAVEWIEAQARQDGPFFLYLAASAPHEPCVAEVTPEFARGASRAGPRGDLVVLYDWMVGQVLDALDRTGVADDTLVIVTSDNGAKPGCGGKTWGHKSCGDWRGYKGYIWEGGHREPMLARWPGTIPPGSTCDHLVGLQDLLATAADIVGRDLGDDAAEDSVSFLPALLDPEGSASARDDLIHHSCLGVFSIRKGQWKLIIDCDNSGDGGRGYHGGRGTGPSSDMKGQLYNLADDPFEAINLIDRRGDKVAELRALFDGFHASGRSARTTNKRRAMPDR